MSLGGEDNLRQALTLFEESKAISERLKASNPRTVQTWSDLWISRYKLTQFPQYAHLHRENYQEGKEFQGLFGGLPPMFHAYWGHLARTFGGGRGG